MRKQIRISIEIGTAFAILIMYVVLIFSKMSYESLHSIKEIFGYDERFASRSRHLKIQDQLG